VAAVAALGATCFADQVNLGPALNYAVLFQGSGNNTLQVTNVTVNGNIGVAHSGRMTDSGPSTITGRIDFAAANTGQFSNNNGSNFIGAGVNYNVSDAATAMNNVNLLSQALFSFAGTAVAINGIQTINASAGATTTINGQTIHVFDASSFNNSGTSDVLTINGTANDFVAINLDGLGNIQVHGGIAFSGGIGADNVIFNLGGGNYSTFSGAASLDINNNGGAAGIARGIFLDPNGTMSVTNAVVQGRVFGGDSHDFQFVSGANISSPPTVPLAPAAWIAAPALLLGPACMFRRRPRLPR
jgi:hypothetical protein